MPTKLTGTPCIIFDIDGTLSNPDHRLHLVRNGNRDWDEFFARLSDDPAIEPVAWLNRHLASHDEHIIIVTGRPERYREETEAWLFANKCYYDTLHMRPDGDMRADHIVKMQILDGILSDGYEPRFIVDDRQSVVRAWRDRGYVCLQARDYEDDVQFDKCGVLTLMVGPSGAGKSSWLDDNSGFHASWVISSDQIRADLCGDFRDQSRNEEVFNAVHALARERVRRGLPTVIDATHLRRKDRLASVACTHDGAPIRYIVIDRPMGDKYRDAGWRAGLGFDLIAKHNQTFQAQLKDILAGDGLPNVEVVDLRGVRA